MDAALLSRGLTLSRIIVSYLGSCARPGEGRTSVDDFTAGQPTAPCTCALHAFSASAFGLQGKLPATEAKGDSFWAIVTQGFYGPGLKLNGLCPGPKPAHSLARTR
jgi:hypothetical protein